MRHVLSEPLAILAGLLLALTVALVAFSLTSDLPEEEPVVGVVLFGLLPLFAIAGVVIFYLAVRSAAFRGTGERGRHLIVDLGRPRQRAVVLFFLVGGVIELGLLVFGGLEALEFTDSPNFCGALCHRVMAPEFTVYKTSTHARVACVECHVGSGTNYLVRSKATGVPLIFATIFNTYDRPIKTPVHSLRPARETCERCHWPEKFTQDRVRIYQRYNVDQENTPEVKIMVFRMGGGAVAQGVHWHIASKLWYVPLDEARQEIGWAAVEDGTGQLKEYVDPAKREQVTPERIQREKRFFDCMDCHNRATHVLRSPEGLIDAAIARGDMDGSLPFVKREGLKVLDISLPSLAEARARADGLTSFYRDSYPQVYQTNSAGVAKSVETLKALAEQAIFPDMKTTWRTHADNLSHEGCFRCHGKLVPVQPTTESRPIDASCGLCHYELPASAAEVILGKKPVAPAPGIPHSLEGRGQCLLCHETGAGTATKVPADHKGRTNETCQACHRVALAPTPTPAPPLAPTATPAVVSPTPGVASPTPTAIATATPTVAAPAAPPAVPHPLEGRGQCLLCHQAGIAGAKKVPDDHAGRSNETCTLCHQPR